MLRLLGRHISSNIKAPCLRKISTIGSPPPPSSAADDEWNDAWEAAWLPDDLSGQNRAPWETDVNFSSPSSSTIPLPADPEAKAFVEEMEESWNDRRKAKFSKEHSVEHVADDYRLKKQRTHAGLWMKEIEAMQEEKLRGPQTGFSSDIDRLLDSCSEIFGSGDVDLSVDKLNGSSGFKSKPDGWELTSRPDDGNIWEISQREEDVLLQEFERRIAYSKFQIASFIKTHIFSRRRPIDGWKYMIEEIGPNARRGKGSTQRLPALADPTLQPFREEKPAFDDHQLRSFKGR